MAIAEVRYRRFGKPMQISSTLRSALTRILHWACCSAMPTPKTKFSSARSAGSIAPADGECVLDLLAGLRVWSVKTELRLEGAALPDQTFENRESWVDSIKGIQGRYIVATTASTLPACFRSAGLALRRI